MKNQLSLIIASATLVLTSAILPVGAYEKHEQAGLTEIYPKPTDAIIVAVSCFDCKVILQKCAVLTGFDFALSPISFIRDIAKGKYDAWGDCKSYHDNDCGACPESKNRLKESIREVT